MSPGSYIVVFVSSRTGVDQEGYASVAAEMERLARVQPGFLGMRSFRGDDGVGITVCYWESEHAIASWKRNVDHSTAQEQGKQSWYSAYEVTVARVERHYGKSAR